MLLPHHDYANALRPLGFNPGMGTDRQPRTVRETWYDNEQEAFEASKKLIKQKQLRRSRFGTWGQLPPHLGESF